MAKINRESRPLRVRLRFLRMTGQSRNQHRGQFNFPWRLKPLSLDVADRHEWNSCPSRSLRVPTLCANCRSAELPVGTRRIASVGALPASCIGFSSGVAASRATPLPQDDSEGQNQNQGQRRRTGVSVLHKQGQTTSKPQRLKPVSPDVANRHEWNSCPSRLFTGFHPFSQAATGTSQVLISANPHPAPVLGSIP